MNQKENGELIQLVKDFNQLLGGKFSKELTSGIQIIPVEFIRKAYYPLFNTGMAALIELAGNTEELDRLAEILLRAYPVTFPVIMLSSGDEEGVDLLEIPLCQLKEQHVAYGLVLVPPLPQRSSLEQFMDTVTHLRAPEGCPWDRKQTHASLRTYLMEETFEALEALDREDPAGVREELGDILLQIALHAVIANEAGTFNISDVIAGIDRKIISRHPHVFGDVVVNDEKDVLTNWDKLKREEKEENGISPETGMLDGVPSILPALSQAQALQQRAARVGFDWPEITPVLGKVFEELEELKSAPGKQQQAEELGDLLFALVNLVRWYEVDAESALRQANQKFRSRFAYIEKRAREMGREMTAMSLAEMDELWEEAKNREPKNS